MLHKITGRPRSCAPEAMSAITGLSADKCAQAMRDITGLKTISGTFIDDTARALEALGWQTDLQTFVHGVRGMMPPTWKEWAYGDDDPDDHISDHRKDRYYIIGIDLGNRCDLHDIAMSGDYVADSGFLYSRTPMSIYDDPIAHHVTYGLGEIWTVNTVLECWNINEILKVRNKNG